MSGGLIYFQIQQDGEDLNANFVADPDEVDPEIQDEIIDAVTNHFNVHKPAQVTDFQVELNDYGLLIDFAGENIPDFSIPELEVQIAGTQCVISFDDPEINENNEENNNENGNENNNSNNEKTVVLKNAHMEKNNNNSNNNNNLKGGKRGRRTRRRSRRNTRHHSRHNTRRSRYTRRNARR